MLHIDSLRSDFAFHCKLLLSPLVLGDLNGSNPATGDLDLQIYDRGESDGWAHVQFFITYCHYA